ncbi:MAG: DUF541 domain-containing protein [Chitinophagaceae bacterium]|nr:MAG: DUF541 domain-containing protein [Chitinophagaceae bacterium]
MKKLMMMALVALIGTSAMAQQADLRRKVSVSGNAEMEITPDIIYISISLKEYLRDNNSKKKVEITDLETQLYNAILKAGIPKENLTISNLSSWNYDYDRKKKNPDFLASKQYRLKVSDLNKYNEILDALDPKGIQSTNIESFDHSRMEAMKRELKVKALLNAKEKATYLVEALGDKLGNVLDIQDMGNENYNAPVYRASMMMESKAADAGAPEIDVRKIKLNFTVNAVFEIR